MKIFNSIEEMQPYYNSEKNEYEFTNDGVNIDITINFDLNCGNSHITANNIIAKDITCSFLTANDVTANNINVNYLDCRDITANDINARNIDANKIIANDIDSDDGMIDAPFIDCNRLSAGRITSVDIYAGSIVFCYDMLYTETLNAWRVIANRLSANSICVKEDIEINN